MSDLTDYTDATLATVGAKWGMGGGAVTSIFGCLSQNDILVLIGIVTTALGFIANIYFQLRRDKRAAVEHELRKEILEKQLKEVSNGKENSSNSNS